MRIIAIHNRYRMRGGEDESSDAEITLLAKRGHEVLGLIEDNASFGRWECLRVGCESIWNHRAYRKVRQLVADFRPDLLKIHNFFPLHSPSTVYAASALDVPVVMTLHNFRLICPNAGFFRKGEVCEDCLGKFVPWAALAHACYRGSHCASAAVVVMNMLHQAVGTWKSRVSRYIAPSEFARRKFEQAGFPQEKLVVKPNFLLNDPGVGLGEGGFALFAGRLTAEKGLQLLLEAWRILGGRLPLRIAGGGPMLGEAQRVAESLPNVEILGQQPYQKVLQLMGEARVVIVPSIWYETFGRVVIEAFAKGTPVIASDCGALPELVNHERTGLLFRPGDASDLASKVEWFLSHPRQAEQMRREARAEFLAKYTAERNYQALMEIYQGVIAGRPVATQPRPAVVRAAGHAG